MEGNFACFNEFGNTEVRPESASADSAENNDWNIELICNINGESHGSVGYNTGEGRPAVGSVATGNEHLSEKRFGGSLQRLDHVSEVLGRARVIGRKAVRDGFQVESGPATEAGLDVGEAEETVVVIVGVEESDV